MTQKVADRLSERVVSTQALILRIDRSRPNFNSLWGGCIQEKIGKHVLSEEAVSLTTLPVLIQPKQTLDPRIR